MKYIIVIVLIILLLVFLLSRRKNKNSNKTSSNIILSDVNPTSCYDEKEDCERECKGYRCSDNCDRSSTQQCVQGETGCYGSEETCKSSCTPVYRCNSATGVVVKDYKACRTGSTGEIGCYTGESQAKANCVTTYICATGPTGCNPSNTFGPPCASGATNCYNSLTSCTDACKGYRCSSNCAAGAKCGDDEPNCYPTSAACSGSTACPMSYRCDDNCTASRTPCGTGGKCFTSATGCRQSCSVSYRCTPDKKCIQDYIPCSTSESNTCFTNETLCKNSQNTGCQKGYRYSLKCAEGRMCSNEEKCYDSETTCVTSSTGYRCADNCAQGTGCTSNDQYCYLSAESCRASCKGYRCSNNCELGATPTACVQNEQKCYLSKDLCKTNCNGYRCSVNCSQGSSCDISEENNCHTSLAECLTGCNAYNCVNGQCVQRTAKCQEYEISEFNKYCFTVNNCLNVCSRTTVFDRIANNEDIIYKIVNIGNNRQIQGANIDPAIANLKFQPDNDTGNSMNPDQFWRFKNATTSTTGSPNISAFIVNSSNNQLVCPQEWTVGKCTDGTYNHNIHVNTTWHKFTIIPINASDGTCNLYSNNNKGYLTFGHLGNNNGGWGDTYNGSSTDPANLQIRGGPGANPEGPDGWATWKIVPYKNGVRI
jgi:hypothetical protein